MTRHDETGRDHRRTAHGTRRWAALGLVAVTATTGWVGASPAAASKRPPSDAPHEVTRPSAPRDVSLSDVGDGAVTVNWTPPASDGRRRIVSYLVTETTTGQTKRVDADAPTRVRFANLLNLRPVRFTVQARNVIGLSDATEPSAPATPLPSLRLTHVHPGGLPEGAKPVDQAVMVGFRSPAAVPVAIRVRTLGSTETATEGEDFRALDDVVTVPAGATSVPVRIPVIDDEVVEPDARISLELSSDVAAPTETTKAVTVVDDDSEPWLYLDGAASIDEGDSGVTPMPFAVHLSQPLPTDLVVPVHVMMGDFGDHLTELATWPTSVTIPAGERSAPLTIGVLGDRVQEADSRVSVAITPPGGGVRLWMPRRGSLLHDDDEGAAGDGPALRLTAQPNKTTPDATTYIVRNVSTHPAHDVELRIDALTDAAASTQPLPAACTYLGQATRTLYHYPRTFQRWSCRLGTVEGGKATRVVLPRAAGASGPSWAGVAASDLDDPAGLAWEAA